jgi:Zn-dependent peptidase ImmA (M78 family)/transcriptional regulator with XRE-family HTH domain
MAEVAVIPEVLEWALARAGGAEGLNKKFPKLAAWLAGDARPTLKQLEKFAQASRVPVGYLLLTEPPEEELPVNDFRTVSSRGVRRPSPDLLDVIYLCQRRQAWYQEYAETVGETARQFVGSVKLEDDTTRVAAGIAKTIGFDLAARAQAGTWAEALRMLVEQSESAGVLVMVSGVVGSNNRRKLDPDEFRGFALADSMAPVIFINGADTKSAQMFTLAHELAHLWLGESGVSDAGAASFPTQRIEQWCNSTAAELLVPLASMKAALQGIAMPLDQTSALARRFKVSTLVILRRMFDAGALSRRQFHDAYDAESKRLKKLASRTSGGGDYYLTQPARLSRRFARAVIASTYEGQTLFTDAFRMLGVKKEQTLRELGRTLQVVQ